MVKFYSATAKNTDELSNIALNHCNIEKLILSSVTNLDELKKFTNLKELCVFAMNALELYEELNFDTSSLDYLYNLENISFENDDHITNLHLNNKNKLKSLFISSCHSLKNIIGLKDLKELKELVIYDVPNIDISVVNSIIELVKNNDNLMRIYLDINFYNDFDENELNLLKEKNALFTEKIGKDDNYVYSFNMMEEFNKRVLEIYKQVHKNYQDLYDVLKEEYKIVKETEYDYESLSKRDNYILKGGQFYKYCNRYKAINSAYSALMKKKAVCEGYVNLLRYFYKLEGVNLYPMICLYKDQFHVVGKALIGGIELYFDPQLDNAFGNLNNFGISFEEFQRNHSIFFSRDNFDRFENKDKNVRELQ